MGLTAVAIHEEKQSKDRFATGLGNNEPRHDPFRVGRPSVNLHWELTGESQSGLPEFDRKPLPTVLASAIPQLKSAWSE